MKFRSLFNTGNLIPVVCLFVLAVVFSEAVVASAQPQGERVQPVAPVSNLRKPAQQAEDDGATLKGTVVDGSGNPMQGASVAAVVDNLPGVSVQEGDAYGFDDWSSNVVVRGFQITISEAQTGTTIDGLRRIL